MTIPNDTIIKQLHHALEVIFPDLEYSGVLLGPRGISTYYFHDKDRTETKGITYQITIDDITEEVRSNIRNEGKDN